MWKDHCNVWQQLQSKHTIFPHCQTNMSWNIFSSAVLLSCKCVSSIQGIGSIGQLGFDHNGKNLVFSSGPSLSERTTWRIIGSRQCLQSASFYLSLPPLPAMPSLSQITRNSFFFFLIFIAFKNISILLIWVISNLIHLKNYAFSF